VTEIAWYWHFLGLQPGASKADIKSAYHRLAKLLHRDHGGIDQDMQRLNEAYHLAMSDNGPAHQEPPRPKPPPRPQAARAFPDKAATFTQKSHAQMIATKT
jgi:curved DNA-binding protein CbpA